MKQKKSSAFHHADDSTKTRTDATAAGPLSSQIVGDHLTPVDSSASIDADLPEFGAPPSNTAPTNCKALKNSFIKVLRSGVDSLYLSYSGLLSEEQNSVLSKLKISAQSPLQIDHAHALYRHKSHLFSVSDKGAGRHPYVLTDNAYRMQLASPTAKRIPLAYVQVKSDWLAHKGVRNSYDELTSIVKTFGSLESEAKVSRADLFIDFTCDFAFESIERMAWICRALQFSDYWNGSIFTGFSFGLGGDISARLYNKTEEIKKSKKDYLKKIWVENGWNEQQDVWRLEFQFKRKVLSEHQVDSVDELLNRLGNLWIYATTHWLKLTIPSLTDNTKSRWLIHPLWAELIQIDWKTDLDASPKPIRTCSPPSDRYLFEAGLGSMTSFMARENISDIHHANDEFIRQAQIHHASRTEFTGSDLHTYAFEKAALKARKFNLPFAHFEEKANAIALEEKTNAYKRATDGY